MEKINQKKLLQEIQKAKQGNQSSFNYLLDTFWEYVYYFQLKKTQNSGDAEDITIRTFSKAFDKIQSFEEIYQFKTWLIAISKNEYIDFLRKKKNTIFVEVTKDQEDVAHKIIDDTPSSEDKIITEQNLAKLLKNIKKLKPEYQEIIHLRFFQELSYKEIAEKTDESMSNVKVKLLRAKKILAEIIKKS